MNCRGRSDARDPSQLIVLDQQLVKELPRIERLLGKQGGREPLSAERLAAAVRSVHSMLTQFLRSAHKQYPGKLQ
jgi:hypothetical protein